MRGRATERTAIAGLIMADMGQRQSEQRHIVADAGIFERIRLPHQSGRHGSVNLRFDPVEARKAVNVND